MTTERERFLHWYESEFGTDQDARLERPVAWAAWQARCPEGWQVVPLEPTQYQQNAGSVERYHKQGSCEDIYKTMLAAAPHPGEES